MKNNHKGGSSIIPRDPERREESEKKREGEERDPFYPSRRLPPAGFPFYPFCLFHLRRQAQKGRKREREREEGRRTTNSSYAHSLLFLLAHGAAHMSRQKRNGRGKSCSPAPGHGVSKEHHTVYLQRSITSVLLVDQFNRGQQRVENVPLNCFACTRTHFLSCPSLYSEIFLLLFSLTPPALFAFPHASHATFFL